MSATVRNFNDLFNSFYNLTDGGSTTWNSTVNYAGTYHLETNENEYVIEVPMVGITRDNVKVDVQEGVLTISAISETKSRFTKNFKNSWTLSKDTDADNVSAKLENGLLTVRVPRLKPVKKIVNVNVV